MGVKALVEQRSFVADEVDQQRYGRFGGGRTWNDEGATMTVPSD
jgi:hypothetical protein